MIKVENGKGAKDKGARKGLLYSGITLVFPALLLFVSVWSISCSNQTEHQAMPKAAIIDQLDATYPNHLLIKEITRYLEEYGFQVDTYLGDNITLNFYRDLAELDYNLLIIRSHSGMINYTGNIENQASTYLFTTEPYSKWKYPAEQLSNQIISASVDNGKSRFFAVGPKFITSSMAGKLDNTVVIIDGCSGLYDLDLARAFIDKGASAYVAFSASVILNHADEVTLSLIKNLCSAGSTVAEAVDASTQEKGRDPESNAVLEYYPSSIGNSSIRELARLK
jgi:hypothetical protein